MGNAEHKQLVLMIGLPSCGKTHKSRRIARDGDAVFEFDEFFYTQVGSDPESYDWTSKLMHEAREWNLARISNALDAGTPRVIVDSDNQALSFTKRYVEHAVKLGYEVEFCEPDSIWWQEIRGLLRDKNVNRARLKRWAQKLSRMSRGTHRVGVVTFLRRMKRWNPDITVEDILAVRSQPETANSTPDCDYPLHRQWHQAVCGDTVGTLPIQFGDRIVGVVAVRQAPGSGLQVKNLEGYQQELAPFARLLPLAQRANRGIVRHVAEQASSGLRRVAGSTARRVTFSIMAVAALLCWLIFGSLSYSVVVTGRVAAAQSQHISCPQDGTLKRVHVVVGDIVQPGQVLAELDTHLDRLEGAELQARIDANVVESDRALVEQSAVDRRVLESQRRALQAQIAIVNQRIERGRIRAAVGGVIVAGDPRKRIGYPLQAGYELFQVACQDRVRVIMSVPEDSIVEARKASHAQFLLAARPDQSIDVSALRFPPAAKPSESGMVFEVDTTLSVDETTGVLLPGMEGVVYLDLGQRNAWWVLTHRITDWLRLGFWI